MYLAALAEWLEGAELPASPGSNWCLAGKLMKQLQHCDDASVRGSCSAVLQTR